MTRWLLSLGVLLLVSLALAQEAAPSVVQPSVVQVIDQGKIDWTKGQVRALGVGVPPPGTTGAQARVMAREAAIVVAERNLLKVIKGVHITSETTVENLMLKNDLIRARVEGVLQGAQVLQEKAHEDGSYEVVVGIGLFGKEKSVASAIDLKAQVEAVTKAAEPAKLEDLPKPPAAVGDYTGVLIDCRGYKVAQAMCPTLFDAEKDVVYPRQEVDYLTANERGFAGYYKSLDQAKADPRLGKRVLIVKAVRMDGPALFKEHPVVSQVDAARILTEDGRTHFLDKLSVGILID